MSLPPPDVTSSPSAFTAVSTGIGSGGEKDKATNTGTGTGAILSTSFRTTTQQKQEKLEIEGVAPAVQGNGEKEEVKVKKEMTRPLNIMTPLEARMLQSAESLKPTSEQDLGRGSYVAYAQRAAARNVRVGICVDPAGLVLDLKEKVRNETERVVGESEAEKNKNKNENEKRSKNEKGVAEAETDGTDTATDNISLGHDIENGTGTRTSDTDAGAETDVFTDALTHLSKPEPTKSQAGALAQSTRQPNPQSPNGGTTFSRGTMTTSPPLTKPADWTATPRSRSESSFKFSSLTSADDDVDADAETLSPTSMARSVAVARARYTGSPVAGGGVLGGIAKGVGHGAVVSPGGMGTASGSGSGRRVSSASSNGTVLGGGGKRIGSAGSGGGSPHGKDTGKDTGKEEYGFLFNSPGNKRVASGESGTEGKVGDGEVPVVKNEKESPRWKN